MHRLHYRHVGTPRPAPFDHSFIDRSSKRTYVDTFAIALWLTVAKWKPFLTFSGNHPAMPQFLRSNRVPTHMGSLFCAISLSRFTAFNLQLNRTLTSIVTTTAQKPEDPRNRVTQSESAKFKQIISYVTNTNSQTDPIC